MHGFEDFRNVNWHRRFSPGSADTYAFATFLVVAASLVRWGFGLISQEIFVFAAFYPAVLFSTYIGGLRVGIYAAILGMITAWLAFIPHPISAGNVIKVLAYVSACALIIWGAELCRRLRKRVEDEEKFRKLAIEELAHRLKNKVATVQSIISFQLRDEPQVRDAILRRLTALAATDDLVIAAQGAGAQLRDILAAELKPYEVSRMAMAGPDCLLSPKLALTMALLIHELATNAAKYGALSSATGALTIGWTLAGTRLNLEWREIGGPPVVRPDHRGFGSRLFLRALDQFNGKVEADFAPTGLVCKLGVDLPGRAPGIVPEPAAKIPQVLAAD
jgi:two-component sensor histidine kinase